jgi:acetyl esterase
MPAMTLRSRFERAASLSLLSAPRGFLRSLVGAPIRNEEGYELDLQGQALLWLMRKSAQPELHERGTRGGRRVLDRQGSLLAARVRDVTSVDRTVPGAEGPRRARIYTPASARGGAAPGLVFFHGGGFVLGSIESHDGVCRELASLAGVVIASVDYRLAPEHRFPAGIDDAVAATRWLLENAASIGVDPERLAVGGDSAGGNLSAEVALTLRDDQRQPAFQLLVYPCTDLTRAMPSHRQFREGFALPEATILFFRQHYLPDVSLERDPRASPLFAEDLSRLPPALVVTAGFDPLRDEGRAYADKMRSAGVKVEYVCSEGSQHGFFNTGMLDESARVVRIAADRLRQGLSAPRIASAA